MKEIASASEEARGMLEGCKHAGADLASIERMLRAVHAAPRTWEDVAELVDHVVHDVHPHTRRVLARARLAAGAHPTLEAALVDLERRVLAEMKVDEEVFAHARLLSLARHGRGSFPPPSPTTLRESAARMRHASAAIHEDLRMVRSLARELGADVASIDALSHALMAQMHLVNNELMPRARALEPE